MKKLFLIGLALLAVTRMTQAQFSTAPYNPNGNGGSGDTTTINLASAAHTGLISYAQYADIVFKSALMVAGGSLDTSRIGYTNKSQNWTQQQNFLSSRTDFGQDLYANGDLYLHTANGDILHLKNPLLGYSGARTLSFPDISGTFATIDGGQTFTGAIWHGTLITKSYLDTSLATGVVPQTQVVPMSKLVKTGQGLRVGTDSLYGGVFPSLLDYFKVQDEFMGQDYWEQLNGTGTSVKQVGQLSWEGMGFGSTTAIAARYGNIESPGVYDTTNYGWGYVFMDIDTCKNKDIARGCDVILGTHATSNMRNIAPLDGMAFSYCFYTGTKIDSMAIFAGMIKYASANYYTVGDSVSTRVWFASGTSIANTDSIYGVCADGSGKTEIGLAALATSTKYTLTCRINAASVDFYVNGVLAHSVTTNMPAHDAPMAFHFGTANFGDTPIGSGKIVRWTAFEAYQAVNGKR